MRFPGGGGQKGSKGAAVPPSKWNPKTLPEPVNLIVFPTPLKLGEEVDLGVCPLTASLARLINH